ncbi:uncharacterized protein ColSpa_09134 [Colletotrichum spaethianum]|uniref:Uncharacterized protein n=1 Tax=Colletotrichum spaethianum TaxID=700344 RepID=A0AA37PB08_9PEZI|nr:uncharacterized protein ColSpa_09134 [Colletotrichum spaethianum]GKT48953.1 hypothetical protein ColSpa_09134 [Colletotrichum spaethianum]
MHLLVVLLLLGVLYPICARSETRFRRPPGPGPTGEYRDNPVYTLGSKITLQWEADSKPVDLLLWQQQPKGNTKPAVSRLAVGTIARIVLRAPELTVFTVNSKAKSLVWTVGYDGFPPYHDPGLSPVYFLQLVKTGESAGIVTSHYFNITAPARTTSTLSARTTTLSSKTSSKTTSSTIATTTTTDPATSTTLALESAESALATSSPTATPTLTPVPTPTPAASAGAPARQSRSGTVAGIAVGVTFAALAVLGSAAWLIRRHVQRNKRIPHTQSDIIMYAEQQLREKDALARRGAAATPTLPWKLGSAAESQEAFEFATWETRHELAADPVGRRSKRVRPGSMGSGPGSMRSGSLGSRSELWGG